MPFRRSEEDRAARRQQRLDDAYWDSPVGQADAAFDRGDRFLQLELDISTVGGFGTYSAFGSSSNQIKSTGGDTDLLGRVEEMGWTLEHVGYVFVETGATSSNRMGGTGQGITTRGKVVGIYLFRRSE